MTRDKKKEVKKEEIKKSKEEVKPAQPMEEPQA